MCLGAMMFGGPTDEAASMRIIDSAREAGINFIRQNCLAALATPFAADDEALVESLVAPGHPSTPGFNDPQYPVTGRVARTASKP